jgi:hypothetical protein
MSFLKCLLGENQGDEDEDCCGCNDPWHRHSVNLLLFFRAANARSIGNNAVINFNRVGTNLLHETA